MARITRSDWGAGPHRASRISLPVSRLFLHHTVTPEWTGAEAGRKLQQIARQRGFADISYSWLVDVDGNQIEGRGWGRQGAHTKGYNSTSHAISLVGNFQTNQPSDAMIRGAAELVSEHAGVGPGRITHGHRDVSQTSCPGVHAYNRISEINSLSRDPGAVEEDWMFCEKGDKGQHVGYLELRLRGLGYYDGMIDNSYGPKLAAAVLKMRRAQGSSVDSGDKFNHWAAWQLLKAEKGSK